MKKKTYAALIAALTISGAFLLNGCSFELPNQSTAVSTGAELSAEKEWQEAKAQFEKELVGV